MTDDIDEPTSADTWAALVSTGEANCHGPNCYPRHLDPNTPWELIYSDDGTIIGPAHASCAHDFRANPPGPFLHL